MVKISLLEMCLGCAAWAGVGVAAPVAVCLFAEVKEVSGPGPHDLGGGWQVLGSDQDARLTFGPAEGGGLLMKRGTPWGLPGGWVAYQGERAAGVRAIRSRVEWRADGAGDQGGRVTWLAGWAGKPVGVGTPQAVLALCLDTAGTNGAAIPQGGPGDWAGKTLRGGLKIVAADEVIPPNLRSSPEGWGQRPLLLAEASPQVGHVYSSLLSHDPATGHTAVRVVDESAETTVWEGHFQLSPADLSLAVPMVGGFNGYAGWASDKGFALRVLQVSLDDAAVTAGPWRVNPSAPADSPAAHVPPRSTGVTWSDFCSVVYLAPPEVMARLGLGWTRQDFSWGEIEKNNDQWDWSTPDRLVLDAHAQGVGFLPILCYTAGWAASKEGDGFSPPRNGADWEDFVEHVVARYSRPPFNLRYFQVWNEPTVKTGFWHAGSDEEFFEKIYLPAAKIIKRYGCDVVFGGWPCSDSVDHFSELLDRYEAWRWTDVLDLHYFENTAWQTLYDRYIRTGKCRGLWQTEIGYHTFPQYLPNCYLRAAHWALRHGWTEANQYKLFWFASWGAGPDAEKCLTGPGTDGNNTLSAHGQRLEVLQRVFGGGSLEVWEAFQTEPGIPPQLEEETSTALGFLVGGRPVLALLLGDALLQAHAAVRVKMNLAARPRSIRAVEALGQTRDVPFEYADGTATVTLPSSDLKPEVARGWGRTFRVAIVYLVVEA